MAIFTVSESPDLNLSDPMSKLAFVLKLAPEEAVKVSEEDGT